MSGTQPSATSEGRSPSRRRRAGRRTVVAVGVAVAGALLLLIYLAVDSSEQRRAGPQALHDWFPCLAADATDARLVQCSPGGEEQIITFRTETAQRGGGLPARCRRCLEAQGWAIDWASECALRAHQTYAHRASGDPIHEDVLLLAPRGTGTVVFAAYSSTSWLQYAMERPRFFCLNVGRVAGRAWHRDGRLTQEEITKAEWAAIESQIGDELFAEQGRADRSPRARVPLEEGCAGTAP